MIEISHCLRPWVVPQNSIGSLVYIAELFRSDLLERRSSTSSSMPPSANNILILRGWANTTPELTVDLVLVSQPALFINSIKSPIMAEDLKTTPPSSDSFLLSYPAQYILLVTINREKAMNSIPSYAHWEADAIFSWFDKEPSLRVAIITGAGKKAFCAGQDLIEQAKFKVSPPPASARRHPPSGFSGLSRRVGKKPIIAAVNGFALGGGFEICLNWYLE